MAAYKREDNGIDNPGLEYDETVEIKTQRPPSPEITVNGRERYVDAVDNPAYATVGIVPANGKTMTEKEIILGADSAAYTGNPGYETIEIKKPLPDAEVTVDKPNVYVTTDKTGRYVTVDNPEEDFKVVTPDPKVAASYKLPASDNMETDLPEGETTSFVVREPEVPPRSSIEVNTPEPQVDVIVDKPTVTTTTVVEKDLPEADIDLPSPGYDVPRIPARPTYVVDEPELPDATVVVPPPPRASLELDPPEIPKRTVYTVDEPVIPKAESTTLVVSDPTPDPPATTFVVTKPDVPSTRYVVEKPNVEPVKTTTYTMSGSDEDLPPPPPSDDDSPTRTTFIVNETNIPEPGVNASPIVIDKPVEPPQVEIRRTSVEAGDPDHNTYITDDIPEGSTTYVIQDSPDGSPTPRHVVKVPVDNYDPRSSQTITVTTDTQRQSGRESPGFHVFRTDDEPL